MNEASRAIFVDLAIILKNTISKGAKNKAVKALDAIEDSKTLIYSYRFDDEA